MRLGLGIAVVGITTLAMFSPARAQFHFDIPGMHHEHHDEGEHHHGEGWGEGHEGGWHEHHHGGGGMCRRLHWKCEHKYELGQEGEGNCRRFREECQ